VSKHPQSIAQGYFKVAAAICLRRPADYVKVAAQCNLCSLLADALTGTCDELLQATTGHAGDAAAVAGQCLQDWLDRTGLTAAVVDWGQTMSGARIGVMGPNNGMGKDTCARILAELVQAY
jgi:hypothetical protein